MPEKRDRRGAPAAAPRDPTVYVAQVDLTNKDGQQFEAGAEVTSADFSAAVLAHWADIGRVVVKDG